MMFKLGRSVFQSGRGLTRPSGRFKLSTQTPLNKNSNNDWVKNVLVGTVVPIGVAGLTIYAVPMFKETRTGLYLAWHYPYQDLYKDTAGELGWRVLVGASGLAAAAFSVQRVAPTKSGVANTLLSAFLGVLTGKICFDQSSNIVKAAHRATKSISYGIDGLLADIVGREVGALPVWEKSDGLTVEIVQAYLAAVERENEMFAQDRAAKKVDINQIKDLSQIETILDGPLSEDYSEQEALTRHQVLLIQMLGNLRQEEKLLVANQIIKQNHGNAHRLKAIEKEKEALKEKSLTRHGVKLTKLADRHVHDMVDRLTDLRLLQSQLAEDTRSSAGSNRLLIKKQIREINVEKLKLKNDAKNLFGTNIGNQAKSVQPIWRDININ